MTFAFEDDGQNVAPTPPRTAASSAASVRIRILATNDPPSFSLPFAVSSASCGNGRASADDGCRCSRFSPTSSCAAVAELENKEDTQQSYLTVCNGASVQIAQDFEGEGSQVVLGFGAGISSAYGYQPSALTLYRPKRTHMPEFPERPYLVQELGPIRPREDPQYAHLHLDRYGSDPLGALDSMQLAVSTAVSPDRRHQYAAETETNSISIHLFTPSGSTQFIDRRTHGEHRLRFRPPYNAVALQQRVAPPPPSSNKTACVSANTSDPEDALALLNVTAGPGGVRSVNGSWVNCSNDTADQDICMAACKPLALSTASPDVLLRCALECSESLPTTFACGLEVFKSHQSNDTLIAVASGCESLSNLANNYLSPPSCPSEDMTPSCGPACCTDVHLATVGLWNFTEQAILDAPRRINAFGGEHHVNCSKSNCSYHRPRRILRTCSEQHDTW